VYGGSDVHAKNRQDRLTPDPTPHTHSNSAPRSAPQSPCRWKSTNKDPDKKDSILSKHLPSDMYEYKVRESLCLACVGGWVTNLGNMHQPRSLQRNGGGWIIGN
jgi:hypothetical protein